MYDDYPEYESDYSFYEYESENYTTEAIMENRQDWEIIDWDLIEVPVDQPLDNRLYSC